MAERLKSALGFYFFICRKELNWEGGCRSDRQIYPLIMPPCFLAVSAIDLWSCTVYEQAGRIVLNISEFLFLFYFLSFGI